MSKQLFEARHSSRAYALLIRPFFHAIHASLHLHVLSHRMSSSAFESQSTSVRQPSRRMSKALAHSSVIKQMTLTLKGTRTCNEHNSMLHFEQTHARVTCNNLYTTSHVNLHSMLQEQQAHWSGARRQSACTWPHKGRTHRCIK